MLLLLLTAQPDSARAFRWRWARDGWLTTAVTSDKLAHFVGGYVGALTGLLAARRTGLASDGTVMASVGFAAFAWEVKDAFYNPENFPEVKAERWPYHLIGDGFSWRDMLASWAGAALAYGFYRWALRP